MGDDSYPAVRELRERAEREVGYECHHLVRQDAEEVVYQGIFDVVEDIALSTLSIPLERSIERTIGGGWW